MGRVSAPGSLMTGLVVDTHALVWYLFGSPRLSVTETRAEVLLPTREGRCAWAQSKGDPLAPAICPRPTFAPPAGYLPPVEPGPSAYRPPDGLGLYPGRWRIELTIPGMLPPAPH